MAVGLHILAAIVVIYIIYLVRKHWRYYNLLWKLPSPKGHLLFGNALILFGVLNDIVGHRYLFKPMESFSVFCLWIFHIPLIFLTKHSSAEVVLSSSQEIEKADVYQLMHPWLGLGLLTSSGNKWRSHRKLLTPSFHFRILENFIPIFNEQSQIMVNLLSKRTGNGVFDVYPYITRCTLDIICETAMGERMNTQSGKNTEYLNALSTVASIILQRIIYPWLMIPWIFELSSTGKRQREALKILHGFTDKVIKERRQKCEKNQLTQRNEENQDNDDCEYVYGRKTRKAFLDTLLEASLKGEIGLTNEMIREETDTFMFEGHDTTAVNISWVIYFLGWCPSIQEIVHQELDRVFEKSNRPVNFKDINELKYLEAVIKETLRIVPSVPFYGRRLTTDINIGGYTFPRGAEVVIASPLIGSDPDVYTNPGGFDPMRFLNEDFQRRHPYAYVPFSAGPRNCIGQKFAMMEEKIVLANLLREFEIETTMNLESLGATLDLVIRPAKGIPISLKRRHTD